MSNYDWLLLLFAAVAAAANLGELLLDTGKLRYIVNMFFSWSKRGGQ